MLIFIRLLRYFYFFTQEEVYIIFSRVYLRIHVFFKTTICNKTIFVNSFKLHNAEQNIVLNICQIFTSFSHYYEKNRLIILFAMICT